MRNRSPNWLGHALARAHHGSAASVTLRRCPACTHISSRPNRGFSLLELLVVIAVAVVLTGLMMPAMRQLHENAHRVVCLSNLQQIGHAFMLFGGDHNDNLPESLCLQLDNAPQNLMASWRGDEFGKGNWDGLGLLFYQNYCGAPQCFYCPSHRGKHPFEHYEMDWLNHQPGRPIFTNYHYSGHLSWKNHAAPRRTLLEGHALVLSTDGLRTVDDFNHLSGMNILRADGSVRWKEDTQNIYERLPKSDVGTPGPEYFSLWETLESQQ